MNAHSLILAAPVGDMYRARALIAKHRATLAQAVALTDMPTTLEHARQLRARVSWYANRLSDSASVTHALGMLGPNGYGPAIEDCLRSARFHGHQRIMLAEGACIMQAPSRSAVL